MGRSARQVLEANDRGDHTVASPHVYPYQWLWDSGFIALGWATIDRARAWRELETVFRGQAPDGFDHVKLTLNSVLQPGTIAFEDQTGGGDLDFNDAVVSLVPVNHF